jgi:hypothetical protein
MNETILKYRLLSERTRNDFKYFIVQNKYFTKYFFYESVYIALIVYQRSLYHIYIIYMIKLNRFSVL